MSELEARGKLKAASGNEGASSDELRAASEGNKSPAEWLFFTLDNISDLNGGKTPSKSKAEFWNSPDIFWASPKDMKSKYLKDTKDKISFQAALTGGAKIYPKGSILFVVRSGILKHSFPVSLTNVATAVNQDLKVIEPIKYMSSEFLLNLLRSKQSEILHDCTKEGTTVDSIELKLLKRFVLPLPPLAEQKVIAEKLDTLLAQVDNIKTRLDAIPSVIKRFRQSVLSAAVSGKLTEECRGGSNQPHPLMHDWGWADVPTNWTVDTYENLVVSRLGKMLDKAKNTGLPTAYLGNINVRWDSFDLDNLQEILISKEEQVELGVRDGDVFICEGGEPGRCAIWRCTLEKPVVFQKALHRARVSDRLFPEWLVYNLKNDSNTLRLQQLFTGTTIKHLTGKSLKKYPIRVPPLEEQTEIVNRVEKLFAFADQIEKQVSNAQQRVNNLTQSILAKAFRGELTADWREQNPDLISGENSAEALLQKIKLEREKLKPAKKAKTKKATST
ncbi:restriction endonuclease subunit S [Reinekea sp. G2M2-21]|uniref:restriction endonuclease subunit S n=1 Tax=Reinekea sp. G2M2-21 TaxID=2788942 RepID=UPI0018AAFEB5|nr:restriction endonuclease subunit S [Reinekea sp. G2M2-21]